MYRTWTTSRRTCTIVTKCQHSHVAELANISERDDPTVRAHISPSVCIERPKGFLESAETVIKALMDSVQFGYSQDSEQLVLITFLLKAFALLTLVFTKCSTPTKRKSAWGSALSSGVTTDWPNLRKLSKLNTARAFVLNGHAMRYTGFVSGKLRLAHDLCTCHSNCAAFHNSGCDG